MNKLKSLLFVTAMSICGAQFADEVKMSPDQTAVVPQTSNCEDGLCTKALNVAKWPFVKANNGLNSSVNYVVDTLGVKGALAVAFIAGLLTPSVIDYVNEMINEEDDELLA